MEGNQIPGSTSPNNQGRLPNDSVRGIVVSKALFLNYKFSFLRRISLHLILSRCPITVLTRLGGPIPDPMLPEAFLRYHQSFCPKAGPSLQAEKPTLQFCRRQVFHRKLRNQGSSFTRDLIGAVASRCFPNTTLSLASEQTLKDLKRSQGHQRGDEESGFG